MISQKKEEERTSPDKKNNDSPIWDRLQRLGKNYDFILIFFLIFFVYNITTRLAISGDALPNSLLPFLIVDHHTIFFDPVYSALAEQGYSYEFIFTNGHYVSVFTIVTGILVSPMYFIHRFFLDLFPQPNLNYFMVLSKFSATLVMAFAGTIVYCTGKMLFRLKIALIVTIIFAFGTLSWAISSQALWQHGMSELLLAIGIFCIVANELNQSARYFVILGVVSSLFLFNRPPDSLLLVPLLCYAWSNRGQIKPFVTGALVGLPFFLYNVYFFSVVTSNGGVANTLSGFMSPLSVVIHFAGYLISVNRGLFIYSPVLIFAVWGYYLLYKSDTVGKNLKSVLLLFLPCIAGTILIYCAYTPWFGGWCFGPRYLTGFLPVLAIFTGYGITPFLDSEQPVNYPRIMNCIILFLILIAISVEATGALAYPYADWDKNVNDDKVWDWSDSQIAASYVAGVSNLDNVQLFIWPSLPPPFGYIQIYRTSERGYLQLR
jgi:hypothetical protein